MIQRIQTLYLLLVVALGITLCFVPVVQFVTPEDAEVVRAWELTALGMTETTVTELPAIELNGLWGLLLASVLIPVLALVDIFLYNKRLLQARLNIFTIMLCLGYYGVLAIYIYLAKMVIDVDVYVMGWACLPLVCLVLTSMATRRILKDEAMVRAADRLR
ncbi:MAG: DUF4293 domain-containing protein [Paludibacteraceae bacterium]|nr:DUF4293 domain-containing protein [Paludibacteraceae bacterium]MEE1069976.1 DUF4293 domain-containing protein [Paludibacteraceae bacterium]MEE1096384.1 DUF4293 domain-containing protein [Paludibacteraceae bacterium]MEE1253838.1 DUF4293 domain-containing protein [Paludibacteraceae bacterium]